jgi:hypothetical protein
MNKPDLVLTSEPEDTFLTGWCSSCPKIKYSLAGNTLEHKRLLRTMFDNHIRTVHSEKIPRAE